MADLITLTLERSWPEFLACWVRLENTRRCRRVRAGRRARQDARRGGVCVPSAPWV